MRILKFGSELLTGAEEVLAEGEVLEVELSDGSRLLLRDDNERHSNSLRITTAYSPSQKHHAEGLAVVPHSTNAVVLYATPLGVPTAREDR